MGGIDDAIQNISDLRRAGLQCEGNKSFIPGIENILIEPFYYMDTNWAT